MCEGAVSGSGCSYRRAKGAKANGSESVGCGAGMVAGAFGTWWRGVSGGVGFGGHAVMKGLL